MEMRLDKVIRMLPLGFKKVCSLVLKDQGLYVIRTGNVGALEHYEFRGFLGPKPAFVAPIAGAITNAFVRELEAGEARLTSTPLEQLVKEKDHGYVMLTEIRQATLAEVNSPLMTKGGKALEMKLKTAKGQYTFVFTHTPAEDVRELAKALERQMA